MGSSRVPLWPAHASERWDSPFLRIGHGGASRHASPNSVRSLELALAMGVDVVEFDVRPCRDGLVLTHDAVLGGAQGVSRAVAECTLAELRGDGETGDLPALAEALDLLKGRALLNLDLKAGGCEEAVLGALRERRMLADTLISSLSPESLFRIRQLEPLALTGFSYPEDKGGAAGNPRLKPVVDAALRGMRRALPYRVAGMIRRARANAVMLYHGVASQPAREAVHALGGKVFVWTVDDPALLVRVAAMGVNGIASNDPAIFDRAASPGGAAD